MCDTRITLNDGNGICAPWIHRSWTVKRWNSQQNNSLGPSPPPPPRRVKKDQQDTSGSTGGDYLSLDLSHCLIFSISFYLCTSHLLSIKICIIDFGMWYCWALTQAGASLAHWITTLGKAGNFSKGLRPNIPLDTMEKLTFFPKWLQNGAQNHIVSELARSSRYGSVSFTHFSLEKSCKESWRPQQTQASARYMDSTKLLLEHQLERNLSKSQGHQDTESVYTQYLLV